MAFLLSGCSNLPGMKMFDDFGRQIGGLFISEEKIEIDEEELEALKALDPIPLVWKSSLGDSEVAVFSLAYNDGALYAADEDGQLVSFDSASGEQLWRNNTKQKFSGGVGVGDGMVLVGSFKGEVFAYNESGHQLWKAKVSSEVLSPPQADSGMVVVRTVDARIFGLDAIDGSRKWVYQGATPSLTVRSAAGATISQVAGAVFAGFAGGKMAAMSLFNGNVGWEAAVSQPRGVTELERMTDVTSLPVIDDQIVCAVAYQGRVACFEISNGVQLWTRESSSNAGLAMDNDYIYVSEEDGVVAAYDKRSGAGMWKQSRLGSKNLTAPLVSGHYIVVGDDQGFVSLLRNYDGVVLARAATDGSPILTTPQSMPDGFAVQTFKGGIYTFSNKF
ncbi:MAG: outer membrane protein assembly factor BamB [Betaproteobacteria bacterium]|nr:outer membrane protein assembly factor BamB [Betaproteobacteria bacterium]